MMKATESLKDYFSGLPNNFSVSLALTVQDCLPSFLDFAEAYGKRSHPDGIKTVILS